MLRHLIEERIEIKLVLADEPLRVMADRAQLGQVLLNLAINARDAMADGGLLTIETSRASVGKAALAGTSLAEGAYAKLRVTDTGTGMTREVRERVFEPFFTTKPLGHGTGLGLSTVYGIVKQHAGRIECDSEPGMGSTFRAYLPLVDADQGNAADTTGYDVKFGGDETVLLVEDEEAVRDLAARALKDFGYNVLCAGSGPEALELLSGHSGRLDLLITDLIMPRMDGRQLAQKVRMVRPRAKLLFMSGYGGSNLEIEVPGFTVLQKPFTAFRLAKRVRQVLDAR
jgi:CheY-like chemotaxis protein